VTSHLPGYFPLADDALISFTGEDAAAFLHAQVTSDVLGLRAPATQYSGYCSPKGRLLATFLLWRFEDETILQLPASLREAVQTRLARYVLRAKVKVADATSRYTPFGIAGEGAVAARGRERGRVPAVPQQVVVAANGIRASAVPGDRYVLLVPSDSADSRFDAAFTKREAADWRALEVRTGIPVITGRAQEEYVPQMVNLDLVGGVSFNKGCYPGQEIVARMHYLGRLKQRMYRIRVSGVAAVEVGAPLYSPEFGPGQASGAILYPGAPDAHGAEALAVVQKASAESQAVRYGAPDGPAVEFLPLPYTIPE
jgi:folate-binding protein YgfZ